MQLPVFKVPNGVVVYDGPSNYDNEDIVVIATGFSESTENEKTGDMIQIWILRKDQHPMTAHVFGDDDSVCGKCKHRQMFSCYVNLTHGPIRVWEAYKRGIYVKATPKTLMLFYDRFIRLGSYGDPAMVPIDIWEAILKPAKGWTGFTHQWKEHWCDPNLKQYCMASCDIPIEVEEAIAMGWTPFFAYYPDLMTLPPRAFSCPASEEQGHRLTCTQCQVCRGGVYNGKRGFPAIQIHGAPQKIGKYKEKIQRYINLSEKRKKMRKHRKQVV